MSCLAGLKEKFGRAVAELGSRQAPAQPESGERVATEAPEGGTQAGGNQGSLRPPPAVNWPGKTARTADPAATRLLAPPGGNREAPWAERPPSRERSDREGQRGTDVFSGPKRT